jgi:hypothetical protein
MPEAKLTGKAECAPSTEGGGLARLREWAATVWEKGGGLVHSPRFRIRPRVSLLSGSMLVLLTLYLPTAVDSCGGPELGLKLASGSAGINWPGFLCFWGTDWSLGIGRAFYLLCLALAALTVLFLLGSVFHQNLVRKRPLFTWLLATSGLAAFLSTTNMFVVAAPVRVISIIDPIVGSDTYIFYIAFFLPALFFPVACLRPEFWTKKGATLWTLALAAIITATRCGDAFLLSRIHPRLALATVTVIFAVPLLPLGLWFRYGFFGRAPSPLWPNVGKRLAIFYAGAVTVDFLGIVEFGFWGLIAFFLGMYLIFFGYWQLRRAASESPPSQSTTYA